MAGEAIIPPDGDPRPLGDATHPWGDITTSGALLDQDGAGATPSQLAIACVQASTAAAHVLASDNPHAVTASQVGAIPTTEKGADEGVATLDEDGKVPLSQLPTISSGATIYTAATEAAMLALGAVKGDLCSRTDYMPTRWYQHNGGTAGTAADWTEVDDRAANTRFPLAPHVTGTLSSTLATGGQRVHHIEIAVDRDVTPDTAYNEYYHINGRLRKFYIQRLYRSAGIFKCTIYRESDTIGTFAYWRQATFTGSYPLSNGVLTSTTTQETIYVYVDMPAYDAVLDATTYDWTTGAIDPMVVYNAYESYRLAQLEGFAATPYNIRIAGEGFLERVATYLTDGLDYEDYENGKPFCMGLFYDIHSGFDTIEYFTRALQESPQTAARFKALVLGGDQVVAEGNNLTDMAFLALYDGYEDNLDFWGTDFFAIIGNHDTNTKHDNTGVDKVGYALTKAQQRTANLGKMITDVDDIEIPDGVCYYYKDYTAQKIRIIALDPFDTPETNDGTSYTYPRGQLYFSETQMDWFAETALAVPDTDYQVFVLVHTPLTETGEYYGTWNHNGNEAIISILDAFKAGGATGTLSITGSVSGLDYSVSYDFSTINGFSGKVASILSGHTHVPKLHLVGANKDIVSYTAAGSHSNYAPGWSRVADTPAEFAVDGYIFNVATNETKCVRYGAKLPISGAHSIGAVYVSDDGDWMYPVAPDVKRELHFSADALPSCFSADYSVASNATLSNDDVNDALVVRLFSDSTEDGAATPLIELPTGASQITLTEKWRAVTDPGASAGVVFKLYYRTVGATASAWASYVLNTLSTDDDEWVTSSESVTLEDLDVTAGTYLQIELTRVPTATDDTLTGNVALASLIVEVQ